MRHLSTILLIALNMVGCRETPETHSALLDDLLSGTSSKLVIDPARAASANEYFYNFGGAHFVSPMIEAQYWGPQKASGALTYAGPDGAGYRFDKIDSVLSSGDVQGWFRLLPQATAASLTKKYRINAKLTYDVLQTSSIEGHASLAVACITRLPTPDIPFPAFLKGVASIENGARDQWNDQLLQIVSEPFDLSKCQSDVFLSFGVFSAQSVKIKSPEVQLLAVTGG